MIPVRRSSFVGGGIAAAMIFLNPGVLLAEADMNLTIVALGDSTTSGTPGFRSPLEVPPDGAGDPKSQYAYWMMKRHPEWKVLNRGVNGERTDEIEMRFSRDVLAVKPQVVIVLAGVNDLYQGFSAAKVTANLESIYKKALQNGIQVVACTILPYDRATPEVQKRMARVNNWIRETSARQGLWFCDTSQAVSDPKRPGKLIGSPDGLHPNMNGYHRMADAISAVLERQLQPNLLVKPKSRL